MATVDNRRPSGIVLIITGALGLLASAMLTIDRIKLLQDPSFRPGCSIDGVLSCGSIMESSQGSVFGFPNPLLGLVAFTVVIVTGILAAGGVALPQWYWTGLAIGSAAGLILLTYLIHASLFDIKALCLWCMLVWTIQPIVAAVATAGALGERATLTVKQGLAALVLVWYIVVITLIATQFWDYWSSKF
ncbi:vitamin K epoxide reductase family protein [Tsukamurella strandjordii]|uniref:Vitamin K epoxide reductase family protein n=1 Tax=Tsukamurella strandjordii TaxID=147577 RepID=A0AA90NDS2_9ACTN|nr:vitamin K epoxide reductase family protein [Tsukamurella strandjordii]MDP0397303.1 vitamin K epoxide reductase family protein [Tsukamurella strandjordii]